MSVQKRRTKYQGEKIPGKQKRENHDEIHTQLAKIRKEKGSSHITVTLYEKCYKL